MKIRQFTVSATALLLSLLSVVSCTGSANRNANDTTAPPTTSSNTTSSVETAEPPRRLMHGAAKSSTTKPHRPQLWRR